jgi:hypothetical protein
MILQVTNGKGMELQNKKWSCRFNLKARNLSTTPKILQQRKEEMSHPHFTNISNPSKGVGGVKPSLCTP